MKQSTNISNTIFFFLRHRFDAFKNALEVPFCSILDLNQKPCDGL